MEAGSLARGVASVQVKVAKDLFGVSRGRKKRADGETFQSQVDSMKGLTGCGQCLGMLLTKVTTARDNVKMPSKHLEPRG